ncbi:Copper amine oxidase domain protein [Peptoniphilus sp. ING2-D1G]|nr:Copper amine oxidase domain protein [Peptoniphilus sp. ING2-D1G]
MKLKEKVILIITLLLLIIPFTVSAEEYELKLWVNGNYIESDVAPFIENGRTLVPVRIISENLGYHVEWNEEKQQVVIAETEGLEVKKTILLEIGKTDVIVGDGRTGNAEIAVLDVPPKIINSRTFVPIRFIAEQFGQNVDWDEDNKTAIVGKGYATSSIVEAPIIPLTASTIAQEQPEPNSNTTVVITNPKDNLTVSPYPDKLIKGNINSKGVKIYHCPGQRDYKKTVIDESKGERWFATEADAVNAGWRKAQQNKII